MKLSDDARQAIHDWRWGPHIEDVIERQEVVDAMIKKIMDTFNQLEARIKALEANTSKSALRRLDAQFTGGTTPTYFGEQEKE